MEETDKEAWSSTEIWYVKGKKIMLSSSIYFVSYHGDRYGGDRQRHIFYRNWMIWNEENILYLFLYVTVDMTVMTSSIMHVVNVEKFFDTITCIFVIGFLQKLTKYWILKK